jgi:hypothetical protein
MPSAKYTLPANLALGSYTILAQYDLATDFGKSQDNTHTLTVSKASTTTAVAPATANTGPASNSRPQSRRVVPRRRW